MAMLMATATNPMRINQRARGVKSLVPFPTLETPSTRQSCGAARMGWG